MTALRQKDVAAFLAQLQERLEVGARQYGDWSFRRPPAELLDEIQAELCDVAGWGLLLWSRVERLRERVAGLDATGGGA